MTNDFTKQWAIAMPNGELWRNQCQCHGGMFGVCFHNPPPSTFDSRAEAEHTLHQIRAVQARDMGVTDWAGHIVQRLCSPFTVHDPAEQFGTAVEDWLKTQGGQP